MEKKEEKKVKKFKPINLFRKEWFLVELTSHFDFPEIGLFSRLSKKLNSVWLTFRNTRLLPTPKFFDRLMDRDQHLLISMLFETNLIQNLQLTTQIPESEPFPAELNQLFGGLYDRPRDPFYSKKKKAEKEEKSTKKEDKPDKKRKAKRRGSDSSVSSSSSYSGSRSSYSSFSETDSGSESEISINEAIMSVRKKKVKKVKIPKTPLARTMALINYCIFKNHIDLFSLFIKDPRIDMTFLNHTPLRRCIYYQRSELISIIMKHSPTSSFEKCKSQIVREAYPRVFQTLIEFDIFKSFDLWINWKDSMDEDQFTLLLNKGVRDQNSPSNENLLKEAMRKGRTRIEAALVRHMDTKITPELVHFVITQTQNAYSLSLLIKVRK